MSLLPVFQISYLTSFSSTNNVTGLFWILVWCYLVMLFVFSEQITPVYRRQVII